MTLFHAARLNREKNPGGFPFQASGIFHPLPCPDHGALKNDDVPDLPQMADVLIFN